MNKNLSKEFESLILRYAKQTVLSDQIISQLNRLKGEAFQTKRDFFKVIKETISDHKPIDYDDEVEEVVINNSEYQEVEIRINIWDFGGQEIMHATHQFFLTQRSLYILVIDSRMDEQENRVEYWLKIISSFGGPSPIIVVCNKSDQQEIDIDLKRLKKKYPSIKCFARSVSCMTGANIDEVNSLINEEVIKLKHIHDELLTNWFAVKSQLECMQSDYISYEKYILKILKLKETRKKENSF